MENKTIYVVSASDYTVVINVPDIPLHRTWKKRGAKFPIDRSVLVQAFYDPSVEALFRDGILTTTDKEFLKEVGLMDEEDNMEIVVLTDALLNRYIRFMPVSELKKELEKLSHTQLEEVVDYAVAHSDELQMDRIDLLSKASGKNILKAIEHKRVGSGE